MKKTADFYKGFANGAALTGLLTLIVLVIAGIVVLFYMFGDVVPPGTMGVRQIKFGPGQGFSKVALEPGYHWAFPFYSEVHVIPRKVRILHMNRNKKLYPGSSGAFRVQTLDGPRVDADISILSRFYPAPGKDGDLEHGGPADLLNKVGITPAEWDTQIAKVADDELRRTLGNLTTRQFYNPHLREQQIAIAHKDMNRRLAEFGIKIEAVLLRRFTYVAERIDKAIFEKNLQKQEEELKEKAGALAEAKAETERIAAEWDAKIKTLKAEGNAKAEVIRSEGDLYEKKKRAEADLLVAKAKAEVDRLKAGALAKSRGADIYVARELAPLLGSLKGGVVRDLDPYNLEEWMRRLGIRGHTQ
ncbi:MAG: hypothetical protein D6719_10400 [Candidatus Dadabacteria bacterium]|nr:MAG: hypothetical protein D6719_10400 [Candidatus Dadabacteria bacterium]